MDNELESILFDVVSEHLYEIGSATGVEWLGEPLLVQLNRIGMAISSELRDRLEPLRQDAERYRKLRAWRDAAPDHFWQIGVSAGQSLDASVDRDNLSRTVSVKLPG